MRFKDFDSLFQRATNGRKPYPFQREFASARPLRQLVSVPTGLGKTATVILGWLWRRFGIDEALRRDTPRRLVYCLPMRVLVEQTRDAAVVWLHELGLLAGYAEFDGTRVRHYYPDFTDSGSVAVHVLMGGEDRDDWDIYPERDAILVGTQDMLLSRALNRGYAASRARWPMQFGLLHTDCLWAFDEIQLMGSGLATTTQLEAFRRLLPRESIESARDEFGCRSVWMSATLDQRWLETVDFAERLETLPPPLELSDEDHENPDVMKKRGAKKPLTKATAVIGDTDHIAKEVVKAHREQDGLTLVVVNTVKRARELFGAVEKEVVDHPAPRLVLLHSRFRPRERQTKIEQLIADPPGAGTICVSTQVVEAGVDIDATTLFTELAPWASMVQRFGRCNRRGERNDTARVFWIDLPKEDPEAREQSRPYADQFDELRKGAKCLEGLDDVGILSLPKVELPYEHTHVIRRRDIVDLFDTTPDLAGNDVDIDRYVRDVEDTDVRVLWRHWDQPKGREAPPGDKTWRQIGRHELCPAPVREFREFVEAPGLRGRIWRWDYLDGKWIRVDEHRGIHPGQTYLVHITAGGYDTDRGWIGKGGKAEVTTVGPNAPEGPSDDAYDDDGLSMTDAWQTIAEHTDDVCREVDRIIESLQMSEAERRVLRTAARWHDWGKAHEQFQLKLDDGQPSAGRRVAEGPALRRERPPEWRGCTFVAKAPGHRVDRDGKVQDPGYWRRVAARDGGRRHFRHELASALGVLLPGISIGHGDRDLVAYLVAAHHGKVRLSIRSMPKETRPSANAGGVTRFARGVWDGDVLPETDLGGGVTAPRGTLSLEPMEIGLCEEEPFTDQPSWLERAIRLRDSLGPFRLAYLEALLRAADMRASAALTREPGGEPSPEVARG